MKSKMVLARMLRIEMTGNAKRCWHIVQGEDGLMTFRRGAQSVRLIGMGFCCFYVGVKVELWLSKLITMKGSHGGHWEV